MSGERRVRQGMIDRLIGRIRGNPDPKGVEKAQPLADPGEVLESVGRLAGGVAHDLNNILLVVQGYAELALAEPDAGPAARGLLGEVRDAAARASNLVRDLLVVGQRGPFSPRLLSLDDAILRHLPVLRAAAGESIAIRYEPGGNIAPVLADDELIGLLLKALCDRAREASPRGGTITISTATVPRGIQAADDPHAERVLLRVSDTGDPLTDEIRARLFEPYLPSPTGGKGLGLGMSIAHAAARRMGGQVELERSTAEGTVFCCAFPVRRAPTESETADRLDPAPRAPSESVRSDHEMPPGVAAVTILLAEDDEGIRALATKVLAREGYRVLAAGDGQQALAIFEREAPRVSLALLDDVMPRMGGRAALERMRRIAPDLPAILCSGYTWQLDGETRPGTGFCKVLAKPWQPLELLRQVREGLGST
jgi:CheY-like chemotaxis protein